MTSANASRPAAPRAALVFIAITLFLDMIAQSSSFPILPRLSQSLLGGDTAGAARWVGVLEVAWAIPMFFAAPILGMLSDRFGRRPVVVISVFGVGAELILNALAPNMAWLLAGRMLCGFTCGAQAAAMAYVADVTAPEERTRAYGWMNAAIWSGVIMGPALGGLLTGISLRAPFWAGAGLALAGGVYGLFVLPESLPASDRAPIRWARANPWGAVDLLLQRAGLLTLSAALLLIWLSFQGKDNMIVLYTAHRYGWTPIDLGVFVAALAASSIAVQALLAGRIAAWLGERRAILAGLALQVVGYIGIGLAPTGPLFWAANLPVILGGVSGPALQSLMTSKVAAGEQGRLQGAIGSISSFTSIVAPIGFTQVFAWTIEAGRPAAWSGATILIAAGFITAAWLLVAMTPKAPAP